MTAQVIDIRDHLDDEIPSRAMIEWMTRRHDQSGLLPKFDPANHLVPARVIRACLWRGWVRSEKVAFEEGGVIDVYYLTVKGRCAVIRYFARGKHVKC